LVIASDEILPDILMVNHSMVLLKKKLHDWFTIKYLPQIYGESIHFTYMTD